MNCYNHPETSAVGMCVSCNKGICKACADDTKNDLTCSFCSTLVPSKRSAAQKSSSALYITERKSYGRPVFLMAFGIIYVVMFVLSGRRNDYFTLSLGVLFVIYGGYQFFQAYQFNKTIAQDDDILDI
jgi:hypothetical protein